MQVDNGLMMVGVFLVALSSHMAHPPAKLGLLQPLSVISSNGGMETFVPVWLGLLHPLLVVISSTGGAERIRVGRSSASSAGSSAITAPGAERDRRCECVGATASPRLRKVFFTV